MIQIVIASVTKQSCFFKEIAAHLAGARNDMQLWQSVLLSLDWGNKKRQGRIALP